MRLRSAWPKTAPPASRLDDASPQALVSTIGRAATLFREPKTWLRMMRRAMTRDFSWESAARQYVALYRELQPDKPLLTS
jgi:starch synthase